MTFHTQLRKDIVSLKMLTPVILRYLHSGYRQVDRQIEGQNYGQMDKKWKDRPIDGWTCNFCKSIMD